MDFTTIFPFYQKKANWKSAEPTQKEEIIRIAGHFCPYLLERSPDEVWVYKLEFLKEYVLVRISDTNRRGYYGFYTNDDFYPLLGKGNDELEKAKDNDGLEKDKNNGVLEFLKYQIATRETNGSNDLEPEDILSGLNQVIESYNSSEDNILFNDKYTRYGSYLPIQGWQLKAINNGGNSEIDNDDIGEFLSLNVIEIVGVDFKLWEAKLSFAKEGWRFFELNYYENQQFKRSYLFTGPKQNDIPKYKIYPLTGNSNDLFAIWDDEGFFLNDENCIDYLKFFCWVISGEVGPFQLPESIHQIPFYKAPVKEQWPELEKLFDNKTVIEFWDEKSEEDKKIEWKSEHKYKVKAIVAYGDALFKAWFGFKELPKPIKGSKNRDLTGNVEMLYDEPIFDGLDYIVASVGSPLIPKVTVFQRLNEREYIEVPKLKFDDSQQTYNAKEFNEKIKQDGEIANAIVNDCIIIGDFDVDISKICEAGNKVVIENCQFKKMVHLPSDCKGPILEFINCQFEKGLNGKDAERKNSLIFKNCDFLAAKDDENKDKVAINLENFRSQNDLSLFSCNIIGRFEATHMNIGGDLSFRGCFFGFQQLKKLFMFRHSDRKIKVVAGRYSKNQTVYIHNERLRYESNNAWDNKQQLVRIDNSIVCGDLRFTINKEGNEIEEVDNARRSLVLGTLSSENITVYGQALFSGTLIVGSLYLNCSNFLSNVRFNEYQSTYSQFIISNGGLYLSKCSVQGSVDLGYTQVEHSVSFYGSKIEQFVDIFQLKCEELNFNFTTIKGMLVSFDNDRKRYRIRDRENLEVAKGIQFSNATIYHVKFAGIQVGGDIRAITGNFNSIEISERITNKTNNEVKKNFIKSINFGSVKVKSDVGLYAMVLDRSEPKSEQPIESQSLKFSGVVKDKNEKKENRKVAEESDANSNIHNCQFEYCDIGGDFRFFPKDVSKRNPNTNGGGVDTFWKNLIGSKITGNLLINSTIRGVLDLRNLEVTQRIVLDYSVAKNGLNISALVETEPKPKLEENFNKNSSDNNANATLPKIKWFKGPSTTCSNFEMKGFRTDGDVYLSGLTVNEKLSAQGAQVKGGLYLIEKADHDDDQNEPIKFGELDDQDGERGDFRNYIKEKNEKGEVQVGHKYFEHCKIGEILDFTASEIGELNLTDKNFMGGETEKGKITLERSKVDKLRIISPTPAINLRNIHVGRWVMGSKDKGIEPQDFIKVLDKMEPFERSIYIEIENNYRNEGKDGFADDIYIEMKKIAKSDLKKFDKVKDFLAYKSSSYGTSSGRLALIWLTFFVILSCFLTFKGNIVNKNCHEIGDWNFLDGVVLASHYCIPFFDLNLKPEIQPIAAIEWVIVLLSALSYIILTFLIFSISTKAIRTRK